MLNTPHLPPQKAIRDGAFVDADPTELDYVLDSPDRLLGTGVNLIPLQNAVASPRLFYGARFWNQADPLKDPDTPLVQNIGEDGQSFDSKFGRAAGAIFASRPGTVLEVHPDHFTVQYEDGEKDTINIYNNYTMNRKNAFHQTPLLQAGDTFQTDQPLVRSNFTDSEGNLALGRNARVALVPYLGYSMDDATVISESFAERLRSQHTLDFEREAPEGGQRVELDSFRTLFPKKYTREQLENFDEDGVIKIGAEVHQGDPLLLLSEPRRISVADQHRGSLSRYLRNTRVDASTVWEDPDHGVVTDVVRRRDGGVHVLVSTERPALEGDKIVLRAGQKGTISKIIPDHEMPYGQDGKPFELLLNPLGIPSRVANAVLYEMLLGKAAAARGKPYTFAGFNSAAERWQDTVRQALAENNLNDTEEIYDPLLGRKLENPVSTGISHVLKLQHQAQGKLSGRGLGSYDMWQQPLKGGAEGGGAKRLSGLEFAGLMSAGAYGYLRDGLTVRGQMNHDYWSAIREGRTPPKVGHPFAWDRTTALLHGAGYRVSDRGNGIQRLGPTTDAQLEELKAEELTNADMLDSRDWSAVPGGLFDISRDERNAWGQISLDTPIPNPAWEEPLKALLGVTGKEYTEILSGQKELIPGDPNSTGTEGLFRFLKTLDTEALEEEARNELRSGRKAKRSRAIKVLNVLKGLERNEIKPHELMITRVPVIPARYRPFSFQGETFVPGDVNRLYNDVFSLRDQNRRIRDEFGEGGVREHNMNLIAGVRALYGYAKPENKKLRDEGVSGFLEKVLGTSPKYSVFQRRLFSKPQDGAGRGVAGLDPTLGIDEIGVPEDMAWELYAPYVQGRLVRSGFSPGAALRMVRERDRKAKALLMSELEKRPALVNRAPNWHKFNSVGAFLKLHDGSNIRVNPLITKGMNLDFNGDANIGYVVLCVSRDIIGKSLNLDLTKAYGYGSVSNMFKNIELPKYDPTTEEIVVLNLADFPKGDFLGSNPNGKNGPIHFYAAPPGTKVIAFDEKTFKPIWSYVTMFSEHPDREIEIVNLTRDLQIITDDDPRAVYGIDPTTPGYTFERFTPTEAKEKGVLVARVQTMHGQLKEEGWIKSVDFAGGETPLTADFGYFLGAMAGDGWVDSDNKYKRWYLADSNGDVAAKLQQWLSTWIPDLQHKRTEMLKANDASRYGDTVRHSFISPSLGANIIKDLKHLLKGERNDTTAGSGNKCLPPFTASAPKEFIQGLLAGLLDTDGTICNTKAQSKNTSQFTVSITSTSLQLLRDAKLLFDLLGMRSTISFSKVTARKNKAWLLVLSAVDVYEKLGPIVARMQSKQKIAAYSAARKPDDNPPAAGRLRMVPVLDHLATKICNAIPAPKMTPKVKADLDKCRIITDLLTLKRAVHNTASKTKRVSKFIALKVIELMEKRENPYLNPTKVDALVEEPDWKDFVKLAKQDEIFFEAVQFVEYTGKKETGYDLTVPGYETFMNSDGVILSNTLGVFVPSLPEAVEDVRNKLMPSRQIFSIRDTDDVVNLPQQDLLLGLYRAKNRESRRSHTFETREDALQAIRQGRVSFSDEIEILNNV